MSRHRRRALACSALAAILAVAGLARVGAASPRAPATAPARQLIVLRPVAAGARIESAALGVTQVPARYADPHRLTDPSQAVGRRAAVPLPAGSPLMDAELAVPARVAGGREVAVRLDDAAGVPAGRLAGVHADLYLTTPGRAGGTRRVLTNVLVVSAGRSDAGAVATLLLPRAAVTAAIAAEGGGSLRLVVRRDAWAGS